MRRLAWSAALACLLGACATAPAAGPPSGRGDVIRRVLMSTVQLRAEREGGGRRAGSGVVIASGGADGHALILTARHFLEPVVGQQVFVVPPGTARRLRAEIRALSDDADLALIAVRGLSLPPVALQERARLGDEVWVVGFPWGRRLTIVSGVVSQIATETDEVPLEGPPRMVDASVSYGSSGGGVFDAHTGALIGIVEGYRTARVSVDTRTERTVDIPVPGETTLVPVGAIARFLESVGR
jgi:S1-C subfamily serine protease